MDTRTIKTYYPMLQTLEVIDRSAMPSRPLSIPFLGRDPQALSETYEIMVVAAGPLYKLSLTSRSSLSLLRDIHLTLKAFQPQSFLQTKKNGNRLNMRIITFRPNLEIDDSQLELHVPPDTQIVYPFK